MSERDPGRTPVGVCLPVSTCEDCGLAGRLHCRFRRRDLLRFVGAFLLFMLPAAIGMALGGYG